MILTLTPNPSIDRTVTLSGALERGAVLRAVSESAQGGGKGVNISRAAVAADVRTIAVLPAAQDDPFDGAIGSEAKNVLSVPVEIVGRVVTVPLRERAPGGHGDGVKDAARASFPSTASSARSPLLPVPLSAGAMTGCSTGAASTNNQLLPEQKFS